MNSLKEAFSRKNMLKNLNFFGELNLGLILTAVGIVYFKNPNHFAFGGTSGLSILLADLFPKINVGGFMWIINLILVVLGFVFLGIKTMGWTIYSSFALSFFVSVCEWLYPVNVSMSGDAMLDLVFAVFLPALGAAIVFDIGASTGGTDIVALILAKYTSMEIGKALMVSDILIVLAAAWRFGMGTGLYCILGLIGKSFVVDGAIENIRLRKVCTIVTSNPQPILDFIIKEMNRSATVEKAYGAYTHHELSVLVTVLTRRQALQLRNFLRENDPRSFITIVNSSEIIGKGFDGGNLIAGLGKHFRDVLVSKDPATVQLLEVSAGIKARYAKQAADCQVDFLYEALKIVEQCEMQYKVRMEKRLCIELALIKLCQINELKKKI